MWAVRPEQAQHLHSALAPLGSLTGPAGFTSSYFQQLGQMVATVGFFSCGDELRGENGGERERRTARHCLTWGAPTQEKMGEGQSAPGRGPGGLSRGHCLAIGWLQVTVSRVFTAEVQSGAELGKISEYSDRMKVKLPDEEQRWSLLAVEHRRLQGQPKEGISEWYMVKGEKKQPRRERCCWERCPAGRTSPQV